jgi:hypothetical protein
VSTSMHTWSQFEQIFSVIHIYKTAINVQMIYQQKRNFIAKHGSLLLRQ